MHQHPIIPPLCGPAWGLGTFGKFGSVPLLSSTSVTIWPFPATPCCCCCSCGRPDITLFITSAWTYCPSRCCRCTSDWTWYSFTRPSIRMLFCSFSLMNALMCWHLLRHNATPHDVLLVDLHDHPHLLEIVAVCVDSSTRLSINVPEPSMDAFCCWTNTAILMIGVSNAMHSSSKWPHRALLEGEPGFHFVERLLQLLFCLEG